MSGEERDPTREPILEVSFDEDYQELTEYTELQKAVLPLYKSSPAGWEGLGTGFCVADDGVLITARHVLSRDFQAWERNECDLLALFETNQTIERPDGSSAELGAWLRVTDIHTTEATDLAIVRTTPLDISGEIVPLPTIAITSQPPEVDDTCAAFGYPHLKAEPVQGALEIERTLAVSRGSVAAVHPELHDRGQMWFPTFELGARLPHGMSGGPIVSTATEGVIGIVCAGMPDVKDVPPVSWGSMLGPILTFPVPGKDFTVAEAVKSGYIDAHEAQERYRYEFDEDSGRWGVKLVDGA